MFRSGKKKKPKRPVMGEKPGTNIHDSSYGGSSSEGEDEGAGGVGAAGRGAEQSAAANALLYVGLGTVAIGLVIAFVGTGEKGFKTLELRLIGPTLIFGGLLCCLLRILLCICPSRCPFWGRKGGGGKRRPPDHDYYRHLPYRSRTANDFLLAEPPPPTVTNASRQGGGDKKRVSIVQTPGAVDRRPPRSSSTWRGGGGGDPLHASDSVELLELRSGVGGGGGPGGGAGGASASGADLHSASSEDSFNESLALVEASETRKPRDERLARLKSTLTFQ
ncbi:uncharacterized protein LOC120348957, partial [Nilaparvata lugens]|uniref:uncharacterized protein LOC120348957 n=1 Tax=Nilaparvata lugens TaxID=108931 RepID=UPI00193CE51D